jgi:hypothetical protein
MAGTRPGGVTLVAVLAWISGAVNIIAGGSARVRRDHGADALWYGLIQLVLGIITIIVSLGLLRGRPNARIVVTVVFVLSLISAVFVIFFQQAQVWSGIVSGVAVLIGLVLLWTRPRTSSSGADGGPRRRESGSAVIGAHVTRAHLTRGSVPQQNGAFRRYQRGLEQLQRRGRRSVGEHLLPCPSTTGYTQSVSSSYAPGREQRLDEVDAADHVDAFVLLAQRGDLRDGILTQLRRARPVSVSG